MNFRMHQAALLLVAAATAGCASRAPETVATRVVTVQLPCPAAASENRPPHPPARLANLQDSAPGAVAKAYALSITEHRSREQALEKLLNACQ